MLSAFEHIYVVNMLYKSDIIIKACNKAYDYEIDYNDGHIDNEIMIVKLMTTLQ